MVYDVAIIGAGAAGLMTAIESARGGLKVILLEGQSKPGAKILMSGGTRCNVTNKTVTQEDFNSSQMLTVRNILRGFSNTDAIEFFKDLGVELVLEPTGKYFPATNSGKTILNALLNALDEKKVEFKTGCKVTSLKKIKDLFEISGAAFKLTARDVVLATGGLSYPTTGSDGTGYRLAAEFGHTLIETTPALTPFLTTDEDFKSLSGLSFQARLSLYVNNKKTISFCDGFLLTHNGFSGPAALDISRHWLRSKGSKRLGINFLPDYNEHTFNEYLSNLQKKHPKKTLKSTLTDFMPERLADVLLEKTSSDGAMPLNQMSKVQRLAIVNACLDYPLECQGVIGYSKAEVTAGGIDFSKVNPKTLESLLVPGLFMAGEILDIDGRIGGFNFQWAWASGHAVAGTLIKKQGEQK